MTTTIKPKTTALLTLAAVWSAATLAASAGDHTCTSTHAAAKQGGADIVDTAISAGQFTTLVAAVQAAGLVDALKGDGPLTVLAPTDAAFAKLPKGTVEELLKPENKAKLADLLTYHVLSGRLPSEVVKKVSDAEALNGRKLEVTYLNSSNPERVPSKLLVNDAEVVKADIACRNGVIHVIDTVLIPETMSSDDARTALMEAIRRGVPVYNHGDAQACARIYREASRQIVDMAGADIPSEVVTILQTAVERAQTMHSSSDQAWALRNGIDLALFAMR